MAEVTAISLLSTVCYVLTTYTKIILILVDLILLEYVHCLALQ